MNKATLRLFNCIKIEAGAVPDKREADHSREIRNGYILDPHVKVSGALFNEIESIVGISGEKANNAFHKSWDKVRNASIEQLVLEQILHYITTYGYESIGIYRNETIYIPKEILSVPDITTDIPLTVVLGATSSEIAESVLKLASSGIALSQQTVDDIMMLIRSDDCVSEFMLVNIGKVKNRELLSLFYEHYNITPSDPAAFLRYVIAKLTDETLLIKNGYLISKIKGADGKYLDHLMQDAPDNLGSIFFRFRPLFLAMKSISRNKTYYNRLRKLARKQHKPLPVDYMNSVTERIAKGTFLLAELEYELRSATVFRKIRLAYALQFRLSNSKSIVYQIRNGRGFATDFNWVGDKFITELAYTTVLQSITDNLDVNGKTIYIPGLVRYALPATEKTFVGNIPMGTYAAVPQDMVVGIYWEDVGSWACDLDLSLSALGGKYGWNSLYRSEDRKILYSGDMTSAPNGASELFYVQNTIDSPMLLTVNYYNYLEDVPVPTKLMIAQEENPPDFEKDYLIHVNKMVATSNLTIGKKQVILGMIANVNGENRFYFMESGIGKSNVSSNGKIAQHNREYMYHRFTNSISLNQMLQMAGANVVSEVPVDDKYIDLSPENLNKTTILDLLL